MKIVSKTGRVTHSRLSLLIGGIIFGLVIPVILSLFARKLSEAGFHLYLFHRDIDGPFVTFLQNYMIFASYCILFYMTGSLLLPIPYMVGLFFVALVLLYPVETFLTGPVSDAIQEWAESIGVPLVIGFPLFVCFFDMASSFIEKHEDRFADARHLAGEENVDPWEYEYKQVKKDMRKNGEPHSFVEDGYVYLTPDDLKRAYFEVMEEKAEKERKRIRKEDSLPEDYEDYGDYDDYGDYEDDNLDAV